MVLKPVISKDESSGASEFLPFARPCVDESTIEEVVDCIRSGWLATGPRVQKFEEKIKTYTGAPYALALTSATAGLHLALLAAGVQEGDEVIISPMTFISAVNVILHAGAKPVFVEIDPSTYNLDVSQVEAAITPRTKAIMPVHFAGLPCDMDPLLALAKNHGVRVVEDGAHAMGAAYKGKKIGGFGDLQVFSFHPCKNLTTAEGGCVTTRDPEIAKKISCLRFHGIDRDAWNRYSKGGSHHFDVIAPGYKCNMSDLQAAFGLHQIDSLEKFNERRRVLAGRYYEAFKGWAELTLPGTPAYDHEHSWHIFSPLVNPDAAGMTRDEFVEAMKARNIGTGVHYPAAHLFSYLGERYGLKAGDFPKAEDVGDRIVSLPLFPGMTDGDQDRVIETMREIFKKENPHGK